MLEVTEGAKAQLSAIMQTRTLAPDQFLRLAVPPTWTGEGDFGIVIDQMGAQDNSVQWNGKPVLLIGPEVAEKIPKGVLDFKEPPDGPRFTLDVYST
ncbi:MAG: hypothetical protein WD533_04805 [Dehalococcoidia bacterium]